MNTGIEWQVASLELSKELKELGVPQKSVFFWHTVVDDFDVKPELLRTHKEIPASKYGTYGGGKNWETHNFSAYTVAELGEMLPWDIVIARNIYKQWHITYQANGMTEKEMHVVASQDSEADARAKMLIYLIKNGLLDVKTLQSSN